MSGVGPAIRAGEVAAPSGVGIVIKVISRVHMVSEEDLFDVVQIQRHLGFVLSFAKSRKEHACENRDDRDDDQELDQSERLGCWLGSPNGLILISVSILHKGGLCLGSGIRKALAIPSGDVKIFQVVLNLNLFL